MADDETRFDRRLATVRRHGAAFAGIAEADLAHDVVACPGWSVADLCLHAGAMLHLWAGIARGASDPSGIAPPVAPPSPSDLGRWCSAQAEECADALAAAGPETEMWTFWGGGSGTDVARRVAHELAVHVADLAAATGRQPDIGPAEAADGIDEFCTVFLPRRREGLPGPGGSVHLHCTDADGEWMVRESDGVLVVTREHDKGSCALRGGALALLLVLWRRMPPEAVEIFGSPEVAARFLAGTELG